MSARIISFPTRTASVPTDPNLPPAALQVEVRQLGKSKTLRAFTFSYDRQVECWTSDDVVAVIETIQEQMPDAARCFNLTGAARSIDRFAGEGRAIAHVTFSRGLRRDRTGRRSGAPCEIIWFSTEAGFEASIDLDGRLPGAAIAQFLDRRSGSLDVNLEFHSFLSATRKTA